MGFLKHLSQHHHGISFRSRNFNLVVLIHQGTKLYFNILFFDFKQHQQISHLNAGLPVDGNPLVEKSNLGVLGKIGCFK